MTRLKLLVTVLCLSLFLAVRAHALTPEVWSRRGPALVEPRYPKPTFGEAVAIWGSTVAVASTASGAGSYPGGAAYVYRRVGSDWVAEGEALTVDDGIPTGGFGRPCALSENHLIAGALTAASAYAFTRSGFTWGAGERLVSPETSVRDWVVNSLSLSGDTAVLGVPYENITQTGLGTGRKLGVYVFVWAGGSWLQQAKLTDGSPFYTGFGYSVSISGDTTVVTHPNIRQAYVFTRSDGVWSQQGPALSQPAEVAERSYGRSAVLSGDTLLISAQRLDGAGHPAGVVYEFVRTNGAWVRSPSPLAPAETDEDFGFSLSLSGNTLFVGSRRAAYVFARTGEGWRQQGDAILKQAPPYSYPAVAVDGQYAVVGVPGGSLDEPGAAYIYSDACATDAECGSSAFCAAGTCRARCVRNSECADGRFCAADGLCREPVAVGQSCGGASEGGGCKQPGCPICAAGECVDGVCCDSACDGTCEACAAQLTGGKDGECLPIAADQDPQDECAEGRNFPASCLADGACDGKRACRQFAKAGTACGDTVCSDNHVSGSVCDGAGTCQVDSMPCAPYACSTAACSSSCTTDAECDPMTGYCLAGKCAAKKPSGQVCTSASECSTQICASAVCCEAACDGPCESCAVKGSEGQCVTVTDAKCAAVGEGGSASSAGGGGMANGGEETETAGRAEGEAGRAEGEAGRAHGEGGRA
ncbi:MAG TPA: FG-GAP repeat protein, partial [Polyangiaceae bacterium]